MAVCHKGAAFLWVHPGLQDSVYPLNISLVNSKGNAFEEKFYWTGIQAPTVWLPIPAAVQTLERISGKSLTRIVEANHLLNIEACRQICRSLHIPVPYPEESLSCMTAFPLPDLFPAPEPDTTDTFQERLFHEHHIEILVTHLENGQRFIRISCHLYVDISQYKYLSEVLEEIL